MNAVVKAYTSIRGRAMSMSGSARSAALEPDISQAILRERNLYKRDVMRISAHLSLENDPSSIWVIVTIGHLGYTGGAEVAKYVCHTFFDKWITALRAHPSICHANVKTAILKAISELSSSTAEIHQFIARYRVHEAILELILEFETEPVMSQWACYAMGTLFHEDADMMQQVMSHEGLWRILETIEDLDWKTWPANEATVLRSLLGLIIYD